MRTPSRLIAATVAVTVAATTTAWSITPAANAAEPVYYHLVQYPGSGFGGFYAQINAAKHSIDMEMYELEDTVAEQDLANAAKRGVTVRVLLDRDYAGASANAAAYSYLHDHGVQVRWAPAHYIFHIKATSFDGRISDISTANLTSKYYSDTRDAELIDTDPAQVRAIERTFANDWTQAPDGTPRTQTVQTPGLVWSPNTTTGSAEDAMVAEIAQAHHSIDFESEELSDEPVYDALAADARRGVSCRVVMTDSSEWDTAYAAITKAGCSVHVFPDSAKALYIHEKLVLDDAGSKAQESMLLGSQNASWSSLHENRELGVVIHAANGGATAIMAAARTFDQDFAAAQTWH